MNGLLGKMVVKVLSHANRRKDFCCHYGSSLQLPVYNVDIVRKQKGDGSVMYLHKVTGECILGGKAGEDQETSGTPLFGGARCTIFCS